MQRLIILLLLFSCQGILKGYDLGIGYKPIPKSTFSFKSDSTKKEHSPHKASILSAVIPGAGQIYNKKYWKAGVVYAGMGLATYFMLENRKQLRLYKEDLRLETDTFTSTSAINFPNESLAQLAGNRDFHKKNRDYSIIAIAAIYVLSIADATVDAHLFEFNVDKNISGKVEPQFGLSGYKGARLTFNF